MYCIVALLVSSLVFVRGQDPCDQAIETLQSSAVCEVSSASAICSQDCLYLFDDIIQNCNDQLAQAHSNWINIVCYRSVPDCVGVQDALNLDISTSCVMATEYMESGTFCSGTCRRLLYASVEVCPRSVSIPIGSFNQRNELVTQCGSGPAGGSSVLQASGILILLSLNMCALIS